MKNKLQKDYEAACNAYIKAFEKKQGYKFDGWVADDVGGIAGFIEQYYFNIHDIVWDINSKCKKGLIFEWQDETLEHNINYYSYSKGLRPKDLKK